MRITNIVVTCVLSVAAIGCVDHRPIRNGLRDESIYLDKLDLAELPEGLEDEGWLFKVTVVEASSPNVLGDFAFPGYESDVQYVKFRFAENALQLVDGRSLQHDDADDPNDDLSTTTERVIMSFEGEHVDVKLAESLDGERTNQLEENTELPWEQRQRFKIDFEKTSIDPIASMAWFYGDYVADCADLNEVTLVPDTYEYDQNSQYMSFVLEATYDLNVTGGCYDLVSLAHDVGSATIRYRFSFHRPMPTAYEPEVVDEKDPVNKKYGVFQIMNVFRDEDTGLLDARSLMQRWDPNRADPVVFYFHEGFPERFKPMFEQIKAETNAVLEEAGARLRIDFQEWNADGIERHFGDIRYSFVVWHQDIDTTRGLLGYGPSAADPRTGEVMSANLNLYNVGMDYYRFLIQDFLERSGAPTAPAEGWENTACTPGERAAPEGEGTVLTSTLFEEMRRTMELPELEEGQSPRDQFLPEPARGREAFLADYHRTLPEWRYVEPRYNAYVYRSTEFPIAQLQERTAVENEFMGAMGDVMMNGNPYGPVALYTRDGIDAQNEFNDNFRRWRANHETLEADREFALGRENIYVFDANDAINAIGTAARVCKDNGRWESDAEYRERIVEGVVSHVAVHEFGHNLGLRHNFYGSVDAAHFEGDELSASVMDYVAAWEEAGTGDSWGGYDRAALKWIYGGPEVREQVMQENFLYCTDEHRTRSPLCYAHDLGITPSQIVLNAIERYDWMYDIRNKRAFRTFWDTSAYAGSVYNAVFPIQRMWNLGIFDWGGGGVQDTLKRLDQVDPDREVLTDQEYDEIAVDFYNDVSAAIGLTMAFYDAVINQPASFRNYQTEFDPYYGDVLRLGIIIDKLFTSYAFMDLQDVSNYNPNVETYAAMYDAPFGSQNEALAQRVLDNMLGASYDTFPWFRYLAVNLFASATNSNLVDNVALRERIAIRRFENQEDFELEFGHEAFEAATREDNPAQLFVHDGEQYAYTFVADRGWHLVSSRSRSPVSYQFIKDYNEELNASASDTRDNYGLKILLAYYEYYNNLSGF